ncbi:TIGR03943 family protein [Clostridium botulinum]|uniref:TIGR03943 family putative permease subunit n=1 Tax=Clostridium botulinum TaxID=1491 RepID=UPI0004D6C604|nr:TIGR03943 family protein [Clostridium botulinum]KEI00764.1 membrane protein [Clostridium botulinum C/D str. BKT75002]KEI11702.1 membrane protein [Clostridium botulinum C/D str. BKT2873]KGM96418.1 membrane protein [Clostridium botulinum D str. CCUG 7971]KOC50847.1 hypothetical protein ADU88_01265 [Clostridium botulinum]MCD3349394.1 TIGR03943 family protein [Clostridium botulinum D/C]
MKRFNIEELLKFLCLLGFSIYFDYLILTNNIGIFISPKMFKYTVFASIVFTILAIYQFTKIFTIKNAVSMDKSYIVIFLTLIIGVNAVRVGMNSNIGSNKISSVNSSKNKVQNSSKQNSSSNIKNEKKLIFDDNNYARLIFDIENNLNKYKGTKVAINGCVYKDSSFKNDEFAIGRLMISCCVADAELVGLTCRYSNTKDLKINSWIKVEGILDIDKNKPILKVISLTNIEKPKNIYVYPIFE